MTLEQLRIFTMVAELGTLKKASEALHKTQPAISQAIKMLETHLGLTLFNRDGYRLALTIQGEKIHSLALNALKETGQLLEVAAHLACGNEAEITLAFEASIELTPLIPLLEQLQHEYRETQIILHQEYMSGAMQTLTTHEADIALTPADIQFFDNTDYQLLPMLKGELVNVCAPRLLGRHPGLGHVRDLANEYQIVVQGSSKTTRGPDLGVQRGQRCWYVNDFTTKRTLIQSGMGWGRLPITMIRDDIANGDLTELTVKGVNNRVTFNYFAIRKTALVPGPVANRLWQLLSDYSSEFCQENII